MKLSSDILSVFLCELLESHELGIKVTPRKVQDNAYANV